MNYPDGMTERDWRHVEGESLVDDIETRVAFRCATCGLTRSEHPGDCEIARAS